MFLAGLLLAAFLAVPLLNLLTPLFAAGMMVHLHKRLSASDRNFAHAWICGQGLRRNLLDSAHPLANLPANPHSAIGQDGGDRTEQPK